MRRGRDQSERQRVPAPLIRRRIASGRGAIEQPNATPDGDAALTPRFWLALVITGVATGLLGDLMMAVLRLFEYIGYGHRAGSYQAAVEAVGGVRRVLVLVVAGMIGAVGWYLIRSRLRHEHAEIDDALWRGDGRLSFRRSILTSTLSEMVIGLGASIGREAAPKLMGGAAGSSMADRFGLTPAQRRLLVACGGGAGFAAVYNVPLGGALFVAEVLYGSLALPVVLPALATTFIATVTAWLTLPSGATYVDVPLYRDSGSLITWSAVAGILMGLLAVGYVRLIGWVSHHRASGRTMLWAMPVVFAGVGVLGIWFPQLFGNGKDMAHQAFLGVGSLGLLFAFAALKPIATAATLGSGGAGGVFTPFLSAGAVLGAVLGIVWSHLWPGTPVGAFALVGAAAMLGASMQAPLAGLVLVLELTHGAFDLVPPMVIATVLATILVRQIDGYSMYSARLPRRDE